MTTISGDSQLAPRRCSKVRLLGQRVAMAMALTGMLVAASTTSGGTAASLAATADAGSGAVDLSMTVAAGDPVPMKFVTEKSRKQFKDTGQGIDVALIDSGVTPVVGLNQPGKILYGPDLSNEGGLPNLAGLDTFGHGTHMAGIIAGDDGDQVGGIAPRSRIVSIKVAGATGETDIAQVIAGIDWVIDHKNDNGLNIRVLNLSLGVAGIASSAGDPLSAAVERAWQAGIVVVAAAGNRGNAVGGIDSPAISPYVIAVSAADSTDGMSETKWWIAPWSSGGSASRTPDVVAYGRSIMSFRVPGSMIDQLHPNAVVSDKYFVGSGSSQAAAIVSGFTAGLLSMNPSLTPDQVKYMWESQAIDSTATPSALDGHGLIHPKNTAGNLKDASRAPAQQFPAALSASGSDGIIAPSGSTWSGGTWNGSTWSGGTWNGASWSGASWSGASWSSGVWSGASWSGASWSGASWSGASWSGASWSGASWSGSTWSGSTWSTVAFSGSSWG